MVVIVTCKNEDDPIKKREIECSQYFPHYNPMGAVAMETRVLIQYGPKPNAASPTQLQSKCDLLAGLGDIYWVQGDIHACRKVLTERLMDRHRRAQVN